MTTRLLVGDVFDRMAELEDHSFDLIVTSPPFGWLRAYLPSDHPQKHLEIGQEATPAGYLDVLLRATAEWRRLLAPHGSIAIELGDTYSGSGGAGGDYTDGGLREGQERFDGSARKALSHGDGIEAPRPTRTGRSTDDWPLPKSLCGIPTLYAWSLAYGRNLLTGQPSPAGMWRVRNLKPWVRSNPPVGALGDKERPATSYITVACVGSSRWFDLDAVRTAPNPHGARPTQARVNGNDINDHRDQLGPYDPAVSGGAPPLDWWHQVDAVIDRVLDEASRKAGRPNGVHGTSPKRRDGDSYTLDSIPNTLTGARGVHIRRALEAAGILPRGDFYDVSPKGYAGAHYAVWPPELVRQLIDEMCPRRVCTVCGEPSRRITAAFTLDSYRASSRPQTMKAVALADAAGLTDDHIAAIRAFGTSDAGKAPTINNGAGKNSDDVKRFATEAKAVLGGYFREFVQSTTASRDSTWSGCGHDTWRPGRILDPFVGSGTTLAVASGMGRDSVGIDLDMRNAVLALERVGPMLLEIDWPPPDFMLPTLPCGGGEYREWITDQQVSAFFVAVAGWLHSGQARKALTALVRNGRRPMIDVPGQAGLFEVDYLDREATA